MERTTEQESHYTDLEKMSGLEIVRSINQEDKTVALAVEQSLQQVAALIEITAARMKKGGRLFYIGAGTSGRLGILDASECPPTFGVPFDWITGIIAGGETAIRRPVEFAEDDTAQAWKDLEAHGVTSMDVVVGIAASGTTPYVVGGLMAANEKGLVTGCIVCNTNSPVAAVATYPVEVVVGPEFLTGSTRMKSGTAQKMVLNMLSTGVMIQLGRVKGNKMVDMQLSNEKLFLRGIAIVMNETGVREQEAAVLLQQYGNVRRAIEAASSAAHAGKGLQQL